MEFTKIDSKEIINLGGQVAYIETYANGDSDIKRKKISLETQEGVIVLARKGDTLVMVNHHRPEFGAFSVEFPGGGQEKGEQSILAAMREFQEETGLIVENVKSLGRLFISVYLKGGLEVFVGKVGDTPSKVEKDADEFILETLFLTKGEIESLIAKNKITSAQTIAAFSLAKTRGFLEA